jgi:hypothetical protein
MKINIPQRVVLIIGAILLLLIAVVEEQNEPIMSGGSIISWQQIFDWKAALVRGVIVMVAFGALFWAVRKNKE